MMKRKQIELDGATRSTIELHIEFIVTIKEENGDRHQILPFNPIVRRVVGNTDSATRWLRGEQNDLELNHGSVSPMHALLIWKDGALHIAAVCSSATFVNGQRVKYGEMQLVTDTDVVTFGTVEVIFRPTIDPDETVSWAHKKAA